MAIFSEDFQTDRELNILRIACEQSLKVYIKVMHYYNVGSAFDFKPFHDDVIKGLEKIANFETTKNLLLNLPVGWGKSAIIEYFLSWIFARNKNVCNLYTSYSDKLITKLSTEIIEIINSEPYQAMWDYSLKKDKKSKSNWSIEGSIGRAGLTAGSTGGTITGLDAGNPAVKGFCGCLVIDDPMKAGDEIYETKRELAIEHFDKKLTTRLRRSDVPIIVVMQRLHEEDLSGYIKNEGKYSEGKTPEQLNAYKDDWDIITVKALGDDGVSIWEDKVSTKTLIQERDAKPWVFYPQRQQEPSVQINTQFKGINWLSPEEADLIFDGLCHVDKGFDGEDGTAFTIGNVDKDDRILLFGKRWRKHVDDCIGDIYYWRDRLRGGTTHTEQNDDKGYTAKNNDDFVGYHEKMNKHFKIMTYLYVNWKNIYFHPETDIEYIREIQSYTEKAKHDDSPDSAACMVRLLTENGIATVEGLMV